MTEVPHFVCDMAGVALKSPVVLSREGLDMKNISPMNEFLPL